MKERFYRPPMAVAVERLDKRIYRHLRCIEEVAPARFFPVVTPIFYAVSAHVQGMSYVNTYQSFREGLARARIERKKEGTITYG